MGISGLSGCTDVLDEPTQPSQVNVEVSPLPDTLAERFAFDVEVIDDFSAEQPARIRMGFSHLGDSGSDQYTVEFGETPPFSFYNGAAQDHEAVLIAIPDNTSDVRAAGRSTPSRWVPEDPVDDCWRAPAIPLVRSDPSVSNRVELPAGETITNEYTLLGFAGEECLPPLEYRFGSLEPLQVTNNGDIVWESESIEWALEFTIDLN